MLLVICLKPAWRVDLPVRFDEAAGSPRGEDALLAPGPGDRSALRAALELKRQAGGPARLVAVSVGGKAVEEGLRHALALGADEALRIRTRDEGTGGGVAGAHLAQGGAGQTRAHARALARELAGRLEAERPALALCGDRSGDTARECFGAFLAHALGAAFTHRASRIEPSGEGWRAVARLAGGYGREMALTSPAVVTVAARAEELPYPPLEAWLASREAEIPATGPSEPEAEDAGESRLRIPVPRVKTDPVRPAGRSAEERIREMVELPAGEGGALLDGHPPEEAARAIVALLRERGYLPEE